MKERTRNVLSVLVSIYQTGTRTSVKSSEVSEELPLTTKQVGQEMRVLYDEGYVGRFGNTTPYTWSLFPAEHPELPEGLQITDTGSESDVTS